ncbi:MAG: TIGR00730 family Rossman fold protein [Anaerolinea sp.]|nr:TIGR00730 family Rossman fold protein [Anaerolinea sp.]
MTYPYRSLCVFCGSADGLDQVYYDSAFEMGQLLADKNITLVYGAGRTGLMGSVAEGALQKGGEVIGVVPKGLESPQLIYTTGLTRLEIVEDIQQRKARMNELSEGFISLPGGFGTIDETFEVLTWSQIGLHRKPTAFLNVNGYFDRLLDWFDRAYADRFIYKEHKDLYVTDPTPSGLLDKLAAFTFPDNIGRWLIREEQIQSK